MRALAILLLTAVPGAADPVTRAGDILKNRDVMEGRSVCVVGRAVSVDQRYGVVTGKHLFRAKFADGTGTLIIFNYGHFPKVAEGETIQACGRYTRSYTSPAGKVHVDQVTASVLLKGAGINAGLVDIVGDKVVALGKGKMAPQSSRPPPPKP